MCFAFVISQSPKLRHECILQIQKREEQMTLFLARGEEEEGAGKVLA